MRKRSEATKARLRRVRNSARDLARVVESRLSERYAEVPDQFPGPPRILQPTAPSTDVNGWTGNFDDEPPWPGEWDNTGGG